MARALGASGIEGKGHWIAGEAGSIGAGMADRVPDSWQQALQPVLDCADARALGKWLRGEEEAGKTIYPERGARLLALALTPLDRVKVVILGQDPYHGAGQAMGLSFSVPEGEKIPPSLRNIYKELRDDCGIAPPVHGDLTKWAERGVLLLNTSLTVEAGRAGSHAGRGWEAITDACVAAVAARPKPTVFILWGAHAQRKLQTIPEIAAPRHLVIASAHPSPLSARRGFIGSRPFSRANAFLKEAGRDPVDWAL